MEYRGGKLTKVVHASTAEEFERELNKVLTELSKAGARPEIQFNMGLGHCAYILYDRTYAIPETLEDEFLLAGEKHYCAECPSYHRPTDGRVKYTRCLVAGCLVKEDSPCCEQFYQAVIDGRIQPKEVGE